MKGQFNTSLCMNVCVFLSGLELQVLFDFYCQLLFLLWFIYTAARLFIMELWKSCKWIMSLVGEGHECLSRYSLVLTAHVLHAHFYNLQDAYIKKYSSSLKSTVVPVQKTWFYCESVAMFFSPSFLNVFFSFSGFVLCVCVCFIWWFD